MNDRSRALIAAAILLLTATLWTLWVSSGALLPENVAEREGEALLSLYQVSSLNDDGTVTLSKGGRTAVVAGMPDGLQIGEELSVSAVLAPQGWSATWVERHPLRPAKRWLGIAGLGISAGLLAASVRRRDGWVWFRG